jgi:exopolysaccharide biosynthesis polyprenyl glycosylphosphotransferase
MGTLTSNLTERATQTGLRVVRDEAGRSQPRMRRFILSLTPQAWASLDALIIGLSTSAAHAVLNSLGRSYQWIADAWLTIAAFCLCMVIGGLVFGLYERRTLFERGRILLRSALSLSLGVVLAYACISLFFYSMASRWMGLTVAVAYMLTAIPLRLYAHEVVTSRRVRVLCIGADASIRKLVAQLSRMHSRHYEVVGHASTVEGAQRIVAGALGNVARPRFWSEEDLALEEVCPTVGTLGDIARILHEHAVDDVVVSSELIGSPAVGKAVSVCLEEQRRVTDQATFMEKLLGEVPAESISADWFLKADVQDRTSYDGFKRLVDVIVAGFGLAITLPFWPLVVLLIRADSRGPAVFKQIRVGQHGRCFMIYKFRTMRQDAEKDGAQWAQQNDARVTRLGRFLRRTRIDELPQLVNILRGDMSLVGPRPERPEFVHNLEQILPHYRLRHVIKPGLTGWAQIHYGYGGSIADAHRKLCYDLYYLKHRSLDLDLTIMIRTFGTFLLGAR